MTNEKNSIEAAKRGFEASFSDGEFYNKQTRDKKHLNAILEFLPIKSGMRILDLGTGSGLSPAGSFLSSIRFPKKKDTAYGFEELVKKYDKEIIDGYNLEILEDESYVTEQVNNLLFHKRQDF